MAIPPTTVLENIERDGEALAQSIKQLALHAKIQPAEKIEDGQGGGQYKCGRWLPLKTEGKLAQAKTVKLFQHFAEITNALLAKVPGNVSRDYQRASSTIDNVVQLQGLADSEAFSKANAAVVDILGIMKLLADQKQKEVIVVPDTNALIRNPAFEEWSFEGVMQFTIAITPTVTRELDELKINHRSEDVKRKAETIIRKFKDYRRRGSLTEGVVLVTDRILLRAYAIEPDVTHALPWLDPSNDDDRHIATTIEIMRDHLGSSVSIASHDINLLNKAEVARIPLLEPPEPKP